MRFDTATVVMKKRPLPLSVPDPVAPSVVESVADDGPHIPRYYDCVIRSRRDEHTWEWWKLMDNRYMNDKDSIPSQIWPMIRGVSNDWSGPWPSAAVGVTYAESDMIKEWAEKTPLWVVSTPSLYFVYKPLFEGGPVRSSYK